MTFIGVPPHKAPQVVVEAGLTDSTGYIPVHPQTLEVLTDVEILETEYSGVYAIGDVTTIMLPNMLPLPKVGVFAEAEGGVVGANIAADIAGNIVQNSTTTNHSAAVRMDGNSDANTIRGNNATCGGSGVEMHGGGDDNVIRDNDFSGNNHGIDARGNTGQRNSFIDNGMSDEAGFGIMLAGDSLFDISGNDFTNSVNGLWLLRMTGVTISSPEIDLSTLGTGASGVGIQLDDVTTSTVKDLEIPSNLGIWVRTGGGNLISNVDVSLGLGVPPTGSPRGIGVQIINSSNNSVEDITTRHHSEGICLDDLSDRSTIRCSTITNNQVGVLAKARSSNVVVSNSVIQGNATGVRNVETGTTILAEDNYWGAADGASPPGSGDTIDGSVDADPFVSTLGQLDSLCGNNQTPSADAGGPYTVPEGGTVQLDGTSSSDPDPSDTLSYEWDLDYDGVTVDLDATSSAPVFDAASLDGPDSRTVALRVTDGAGESLPIDTAVVTVTNVVPTAEARPDQDDLERVDGLTVTLDGSVSSDPVHPLGYSWTDSVGTVVGTTATATVSHLRPRDPHLHAHCRRWG